MTIFNNDYIIIKNRLIYVMVIVLLNVINNKLL